MKTVLKFITFVFYSISLFFVNDIGLLIGILFFQIIFMLVCRISAKEAIRTIAKLMPFIIFTVLVNVWANEFIRSGMYWNSIDIGLSYYLYIW